MKEPIKVGDLVMVVRGHSCQMGVPDGPVREIEPQLKEGCYICYSCGSRIDYEGAWVVTGEERIGHPLTSLMRLPPLSDLEGQKDSSGLDERHEFYEALRKMAEGLRS